MKAVKKKKKKIRIKQRQAAASKFCYKHLGEPSPVTARESEGHRAAGHWAPSILPEAIGGLTGPSVNT